MKLNGVILKPISDHELCQLSRAGDRDAFGHIVERYQSLVCSLAYSSCGSVARSEDLAQETFVTAWQRLGDLREPSKLRSWLCGIVRNLSANASRKEARRGGDPQPIDSVLEPQSTEADPATQAAAQEEQALLWRSLAGIPEIYREPMVLFYREGRSVAEVATALDLSEQTVRQRLSRGRGMLREELAALVESTLTRTRPTAAFTLGVLAALPMASASAATAVVAAGTAAQSGASAAGKGFLAKIGLGPLIGPLIGLFFAYLGTKAAASTARSEPERECILRYTRYGIIVFCLVMTGGLVAALSQAGKLYTASAIWLVVGVTAWTAALVGGIMLLCHRMDRAIERIRVATHTTDAEYAKVLAARGKCLRLPRHIQSRTCFFGLPLFSMVWGGHSADRSSPRIVHGWVAIGDMAVSPFLACGGLAVAPIALGAISVGVLSLSIFWGVGIGVFAFGSLAFGWWAVGMASAGLKCAVGFAAVARDYAFGLVAHARETSAVPEWVLDLFISDFVAMIVEPIHWWILGSLVFAFSLRAWRNRQGMPSVRS